MIQDTQIENLFMVRNNNQEKEQSEMKNNRVNKELGKNQRPMVIKKEDSMMKDFAGFSLKEFTGYKKVIYVCNYYE